MHLAALVVWSAASSVGIPLWVGSGLICILVGDEVNEPVFDGFRPCSPKVVSVSEVARELCEVDPKTNVQSEVLHPYYGRNSRSALDQVTNVILMNEYYKLG